MFEVLTRLKAETDEEKVHVTLLQTHLASWLDGMNQGHISNEAAKGIQQEMTRRLQSRGVLDADARLIETEVSATTVWTQLSQTMGSVGEQICTTCDRVQKLADLRVASDGSVSPN